MSLSYLLDALRSQFLSPRDLVGQSGHPSRSTWEQTREDPLEMSGSVLVGRQKDRFDFIIDIADEGQEISS